MIDQLQQLERENTMLKKYFQRLINDVEQSEQEDGVCRMVISKEKILEDKAGLEKLLTDNLLDQARRAKKENELIYQYLADCPRCPLDDGKCRLKVDGNEESCIKAIKIYFTRKAREVA